MPIVTLTTDFGLADHYAGVMKGVILGLAPTATLVDITHEIPPQDLLKAAVVLANTVPHFPRGTIHVVVVDPGVGSDRRVLVMEVADQLLLVPDNGVATLLLDRHPARRITAVEERRFFRSPVCSTFHGRDIFAPVAGHLAAGLAPGVLGPAVEDPVRLEWPQPRIEPGRVEGEVLYVDHFGNLVTTIGADAAAGLGEGARALLLGRAARLVRTYSDGTPGEVVALVGSSDLVEISVVNGSAAQVLGAGPGTAAVLVAGPG